MSKKSQLLRIISGMILGILLALAFIYGFPKPQETDEERRSYLDPHHQLQPTESVAGSAEIASKSTGSPSEPPPQDSSESDSGQWSHVALADGRNAFIDPETGELGGWDFWTPEQKAVLGLDQDMQPEIYEEYDQNALENLIAHGDFLAMWHLSREIADTDPARAQELWLDVVAITGKPAALILDAIEWAQHTGDFDKYMTYEYLALELGYGDALVREQFMIGKLGQERAGAAKTEAIQLLDFVRERRSELTGKELVIPERVFYEKPPEAPPPPNHGKDAYRTTATTSE